MSGKGEGGQQQLLPSKFLAGFVCHIEKNEVETNAGTFLFTGVLFPFFSFFFFLIVSLIFFISPLSFCSFLTGLSEKIKFNCFNLA